MKTVHIASDHGGFKLKLKIVPFLQKKGYNIIDYGPFWYDPKDDYPDFVIPLARQVVKKKELGVVLCRNGQGVSIACNKVKGARAVTGFSKAMIATTRRDDNANIVAIPSDYLPLGAIKSIIKIFLSTPFSNLPRHKRRLAKVAKIK